MAPTNLPGSDAARPFGYNDRNELTSSSRSGQTWVHGYDPIGNRTTATHGGVVRTYESNNLNEYAHVDTSGAISDAQKKFVHDFAAAWDKVMNLDRFNLA